MPRWTRRGIPGRAGNEDLIRPNLPCRSPALVSASAALLISLLAGCATAVPLGGGTAAFQADPSIRSGILGNGVGFSIRENRDPAGRIYLRLIVKAGSLDESDDLLGAAHFVEHMAFRGTRSFPGQALSDYLQSIGMKMGDEFNARTGYDSTEFRLEVPSRDEAVVKKAFLVLRDWADGVTFDPAAVEDERPVVLEEERLQGGPIGRVRNGLLAGIYGTTRYARGPVIGRPETIKRLDAVKLKSFYDRWYRPELMSIVVVGDLSPDTAEGLIREDFESLSPRGGPDSASRSVPFKEGLGTAVAVDPGLGNSALEIAARVPLVRSSNEDEYLRNLERAVALDLLRKRFAEALRLGSESGIQGLVFDEAEYGDDYLMVTIAVSFRDADWRRVLTSILGELDRVSTYGYSRSEIDEVEKGRSAVLEREGVNGLTSAEWASRLSRAVLRGVVPLSVEKRSELNRTFFSRLNPMDLANVASYFRRAPERFVLLSMSASKAQVPTSEELGAALSQEVADLGPWKVVVARRGIMDRMPAPKTPISAVARPESDLTELDYANGLRVVLKRTELRPDEIAMYGFALRDSARLTDQDYANVILSPSIIPGSGFPGITPESLKETLAGRGISLSVGVEETEVSIRGSSGREGIELLLQLLHRTMTDPIVDDGYFRLLKVNAAANGRNFHLLPNKVLEAEIVRHIYPGEERRLSFSREADANLLDKERLRNSFLALFGEAKGFTFCFAGSFDPAVMRAECDRYLGSLPAGDPSPMETVQDIRGGSFSTTIRAGSEDRATVKLVYITPLSATDPLTVDGLALVAEALKRELRADLRGVAGGSYDPAASASTHVDRGYSLVVVSFQTSPGRADELKSRAEALIQRLRSTGIRSEDLDAIILASSLETQKNSQKNSFLAQGIAKSLGRGGGTDPIASFAERLHSIDSKRIAELLRVYLDPENLAAFTLLPAGAN